MKHQQKLLSIAIIGFGNIAQNAHSLVLKYSQAHLAQIIDPNPKIQAKVKSLFGNIPVNHTIEELMPCVNVVIVSSPNALHYSQVKWLLNNQISVLCEKPLATTYKNTKHLVNLAKRNKVILQVGYYRRFHENVREVKHLIRSKELGKITSCEVFTGAIETSSTLPPSMYSLALSGGGVYLDFGVHLIDRLYTWFDKLKLVSYQDDALGGVEANARVVFKGKVGNIEDIPIKMNFSRTNNLGYYSLIKFEKAWIKMTHNQGYRIYISPPVESILGKKQIWLNYNLSTEKNNLSYFKLQWNEFVARINGGKEKYSNLALAVQTSKLVEECYKNRKNLKLSWEREILEYLS